MAADGVCVSLTSSKVGLTTCVFDRLQMRAQVGFRPPLGLCSGQAMSTRCAVAGWNCSGQAKAALSQCVLKHQLAWVCIVLSIVSKVLSMVLSTLLTYFSNICLDFSRFIWTCLHKKSWWHSPKQSPKHGPKHSTNLFFQHLFRFFQIYLDLFA